MPTKRQHFVPRVYMKAWETKVETIKEPDKKFDGVYVFQGSNIGEGANRNSVLWKPHLYTIGFRYSYICKSCPRVKQEFVNMIYDYLRNGAKQPIYGKYGYSIIRTKKSINKHFSLEQDVEPQKYVELLQEDVPAQTLSVSALLNERQKKQVVEQLKAGNVEFEKGSLTVEEYSLMRKLANILLHDLVYDKHSRVRQEFDQYLTEDTISTIKEAFQTRSENIDEDINVSLTQTERMIKAISEGMKYPRVNMYGYANYEETVAFLEQLCEIFDWEKYERKMVGNLKDGKHPSLRRYAYTLSQWFQGKSLQYILNDAIVYKQQNHGQVYFNNHTKETYDGTQRHNNKIIAETLDVINEVILFAFSNAFMTFTSEYKKYHGLETLSNDWYEFVEYGSTSPITIMLQRNGFSREAATYIKESEESFIAWTEDGCKVRNSIFSCENATVRREAEEVHYNIPELFCQ